MTTRIETFWYWLTQVHLENGHYKDSVVFWHYWLGNKCTQPIKIPLQQSRKVPLFRKRIRAIQIRTSCYHDGADIHYVLFQSYSSWSGTLIQASSNGPSTIERSLKMNFPKFYGLTPSFVITHEKTFGDFMRVFATHLKTDQASRIILNLKPWSVHIQRWTCIIFLSVY